MLNHFIRNVFDVDALDSLTIKRGWCTLATNDQFNKFFRYAREVIAQHITISPEDILILSAMIRDYSYPLQPDLVKIAKEITENCVRVEYVVE